MSSVETERDVQILKSIVLGETGSNGLRGEVSRIKRDLYHNPETGEVGLVADVREIKKLVVGMRAGFWVMNFFLGSGLLLAFYKLVLTAP